MASDFPYMLSVKNLPAILDRIKEAGTPPKFTHEFLKTSLGFSSSTDRAVIPVLKSLGFVSSDGIPSPRYNEFRDGAKSGQAVAAGLREGWAGLFLSDQRAYDKTTTQLKELFKTVSGKGEAVAEKMATTFKALAQRAEWSGISTSAPIPEDASSGPSEDRPTVDPSRARAPVALHHDIHIHLPPTSDVSVYSAIFRALKSELLD